MSLFRNDFVCELVGHELFFLIRLVSSACFSEKFPKAGGGVPGAISSGWPQSSENQISNLKRLFSNLQILKISCSESSKCELHEELGRFFIAPRFY